MPVVLDTLEQFLGQDQCGNRLFSRHIAFKSDKPGLVNEILTEKGQYDIPFSGRTVVFTMWELKLMKAVRWQLGPKDKEGAK